MEKDEFDKIEAYINGEMNSEETRQFKNQLAANSRLAQRVKLYQEAEQTLKFAQSNKDNQNNLQQTLATMRREYSKAPGKVLPLRKINKWYAAAAAILVIAFSVFLLQQNKPSSHQQLYAQYAVFPVLSGTRGSNDSLLFKAIENYNNKNFIAAEPLLKQVLASDSADMDIQLAYYICALQTGNFPAALRGFSKIAATENVFTYQARWYVALSWLKQGDVEACKKILNGIPADADVFLKASQLLKELK